MGDLPSDERKKKGGPKAPALYLESEEGGLYFLRMVPPPREDPPLDEPPLDADEGAALRGAALRLGPAEVPRLGLELVPLREEIVPEFPPKFR